MTHLEMMKEILEGQQERGIENGDWERADYIVTESSIPDCTDIFIPTIKAIFVFNRNGRFVGIL